MKTLRLISIGLLIVPVLVVFIAEGAWQGLNEGKQRIEEWIKDVCLQ